MRQLQAPLRFAKSLLILSLLLDALIGIESLVLQRFGTTTIAALSDMVVSTVHPIQDHAAVILFDGKDPDIDSGWPLDYGRWERVVLNSWCAGTRVLVLDIGFSRPGKKLSSVIADTRSHFASVLLALSGRPSEQATAQERAALFTQNCAPAGETSRGRTSPTVMPITIAPVAGSYDLPALQEMVRDVAWDRDGSYYAVGESGMPTAGLQAARDWCSFGGTASGCATINDVPPAILVRDTVSTPAEQTDYSAPDSHRRFPWNPPSCFYRNGEKSLWLLAAVAADGPLVNWRTCPPLPTITHRQLDDPRSTLPSTLGGRMVFVGTANLTGLNDTADTLLHKALPGVMIHALAADTFLHSMQRPMPNDVIVLALLLPILWLALLLRIITQRYFESTIADRKARPDIFTFLASATVFLGLIWNWPLLPLAGWSILVFITLGGRSWDPAERIASYMDRIRHQVYRGTIQPLQAQEDEGGV